MLKKPSDNRSVSLLIALALTVLLSGQAFACLFPSPAEMRQGPPMACCSQKCQMDTTPQAAQRVCAQSVAAINQEAAVSSASSVKMALKDLPSVDVCVAHEILVTFPITTFQSREDHPASAHSAIPIYLLTRSLLI